MWEAISFAFVPRYSLERSYSLSRWSVFFWAFCTMGAIVAYLVCRGWIIAFTGDVNFLPSLVLLPDWLFPVSGVLLMFLFFFVRGWRDK